MLEANIGTSTGVIDPAQLSHEEAKLLMLEINLTNGHSGALAEGRLDDPAGPVTVVRGDGGHLVREHIETCCQYVKQKIEPKLQAADTLAKREVVLHGLTKTDFLRFAAEYQLEMAAHEGCQGCDRPDCSGTAAAWLRTVSSP